MRRYKLLVTLLLVILCSTFICVSCNKDTNETNEQIDLITIVVRGNTDEIYQVDSSKISITEGLYSIFEYLNIEYIEEEQLFVKIGVLESDFANDRIINIYTSENADQDVTKYAKVVNYEGIVLKNISKDVADLTITKDTVILIKVDEI